MTFILKSAMCEGATFGSNNPNHQYNMSGEEVHTLEVIINEKGLGVTINGRRRI